MNEVDVDRLISTVLRNSSSACWATNLEPDTSRFVEGVRNLVLQGKSVNFTRVRDTLYSQFGVNLSRSTVRSHIKGECSCHKTK